MVFPPALSMSGVPTPFIDGVLGLARLRESNLGLLDNAATPISPYRGAGASRDRAVIKP